MQREDIVRFWGRDNLRRWSSDDLRDVAIPESSKSFLVDIGLPRRADWTMRFDDDEARRLPRLPNKPSYRRIGLDYNVPICLDEQRNGCVVLVEEDVGTERYINSSVELYGGFLVYYHQCRLAARATTADLRLLVAATEQRMRNADPAAFRDVEDCWPVIIEHMVDSLE
jgi:hypothetical protein